MGKNQSNSGYFITIEGGEGSGKTSQIKRLRDKLVETGKQVVVTREPGGTNGAEAIRHVLLSGAAEPMGPEFEAMLFAAARSDHVEMVIRPALKEGKFVICDRFIDSTRVYQGATGNVDIQFLKELEEIACEGALPDLTLILDLPPEEGMKRANARRTKGTPADRFEKDTLALQQKRRTAYRKIAKEDPDRCVLIDASGTETAVFKRLWSVVESRIESLELLDRDVELVGMEASCTSDN